MSCRHRLVRSVTALALLAACAAPAAAQYSFAPIALSGALFDPFGFDVPALNGAGLVAFRGGLLDPDPFDPIAGIFRSDGTTLTTIALQTNFRRFGDVSINQSGQVGFEASPRPRGEGIFRGEGGPVTTIARTDRAGGDFDFVNAGPQLNAGGLVAFIGERIVGPSFINGVFVGSGGALTALYDELDEFDFFTGNPSLNDGGFVAFRAGLDAGGTGLFLGDGGAATTVALTGAEFATIASDPSLNDVGQVAFRAQTGPTGEGIFLFSGGAVTPIVEGDFPTIAALGDPSLNNVGEVAFILEPDFGNQILVTGPDPVADRVIGVGDALFGRIVTGLLFGREGLNDAGQLAFTAFFDDGSSAVVLATPGAAVVPEPATVLLVAGALPVLVVVARRRRR